MVVEKATDRFPSPFEITSPPGAEGWESMYPYYYIFSEERRGFEEGKLWFQDGMHHPEPLYPFDTITAESWWLSLGQYNSRVFIVPPAVGIDQRVLNGYLYISANTIDDPAVVEARVAHFMERAGYYYQHWDELYAQWKTKAEAAIQQLEAITVPSLPEMEDIKVVTEGRGVSSAYYLIETYNRLLESMTKMWQYHFEMLNLGYAAYLTFMDFCGKAFPGIADQTVAKMVAGIDIMMFRPDDELKRLSQRALDLGVADCFQEGRSVEQVEEELRRSPGGPEWLADLERTKHPWFYFSNSYGFYHHHRSWIDDLTFPFAAIRGYVDRIRKGESLQRPLERILEERERISGEYLALLSSDEDRKSFQDLLNLARTVYPYVEDHNFFVEHWHHTVFWNKMRDFARVFVEHGFFADIEDLFYLHRYEIYNALYDLVASWAVGTPARGPRYWPPIVARRKEMMAALRQWSPPPALGVTPEVINEPFTIMLWGITTQRMQDWLGPQDGSGDRREMRGFAGSPGVVEGVARVIFSPREIDLVQDGEVLVAPITAPSWGPVFGRIAAAVSDIGGIMSHAAIVCREYGLPAVVGTGFATKRIQNGQRVRVDGTTGVVTILD